MDKIFDRLTIYAAGILLLGCVSTVLAEGQRPAKKPSVSKNKATETAEWKKTLFSDSADAYDRFLRRFPDGQHANDAKREIEWFGAMAELVSKIESDGGSDRFTIAGIDPVGSLRRRVHIKDGYVKSGVEISTTINLLSKSGQFNPDFGSGQFTIVFPFSSGILFQFEGIGQLESQADFSEVFKDERDQAICLGSIEQQKSASGKKQKSEIIQKFKGYSFFGDGDERDRLTFAICRGVGLVHVWGKGRVKTPTGEIMELGY